MRLSISNIAWPTSEDQATADLLTRHGVDAIDVAPSRYFQDFAAASAADLTVVRDWWADRGIEIVGMQALLYGTTGLNLFADMDVRDAMLAHLGNVCRIAEGLGAGPLVFGSPRNRDRSGLEDDVVLEIAVDFFQRLGTIAESHGCVICLEANPPSYGANFMTDTPSTAAIVRATGHSAVRMQLDIGAIVMNGEHANVLLTEYSALVAHIHASEPDLAVLGDAGHDHRSIAAAIRVHCPDRVVTIEMREAAPDPIAAIDRALRYAVATYGKADAA